MQLDLVIQIQEVYSELLNNNNKVFLVELKLPHHYLDSSLNYSHKPIFLAGIKICRLDNKIKCNSNNHNKNLYLDKPHLQTVGGHNNNNQIKLVNNKHHHYSIVNKISKLINNRIAKKDYFKLQINKIKFNLRSNNNSSKISNQIVTINLDFTI